MTALLSGGNWWARVEEKGAPQNVTYWRVVAWERLDATEFDEQPGLVAWINGSHPIRSDQFTDRVHGDYVHTGYVDELPEGASAGSWY